MRKPLEERIERVPWSGCWIWTGATNDDGYGRLYGKYVNGRQTAHRWSYQRFVAEIPDGMSVLHTCDVCCCINPSHLYLGTQLDNIRDRVLRGHSNSMAVSGENSVVRKITKEIAKRIRELPDDGPTLAKKFNISTSQVYRIKTRQSWKHI